MPQTGRRRFSGDPHEILGVSRDADAREIRAAYRRLAKQYHPDVNKAPDAAQRMARINWAYQIAMEHARHEGPRVYRGGSHRGGPRSGRVRWYVRRRPPPQGGRLVVETRSVALRGQRGENANVEGVVLVRNSGTGPLEGEARATPPHVIVRPKQFALDPNESQMFRVSVPNRYCESEATEATVVFESNGGEDRARIDVPAAGDVLLALEPSVVDLGQLAPGEVREARMRLSFRGAGLPRIDVESDADWLQVRAVSLPRRTQYYRVTARAPAQPGDHEATVWARVGAATSRARVRMTVAAADEALRSDHA